MSVLLGIAATTTSTPIKQMTAEDGATVLDLIIPARAVLVYLQIAIATKFLAAVVEGVVLVVVEEVQVVEEAPAVEEVLAAEEVGPAVVVPERIHLLCEVITIINLVYGDHIFK